jgi:Ser/Thr protein kinase RdoA (MazF antagonist)
VRRIPHCPDCRWCSTRWRAPGWCGTGSRCTIRGRTASGIRFVKVLSEGIDDQQDARARWESSESGALSFAVAEPRGWDVQTRSSWYAAVPGGPALPALARAGDARLARKIGVALGQLAVAPLRPTRRTDAADQLTRTRRALTRAGAAAPELVDELAEAAERLARAHEQLDVRPLVPVHGAAHLGQWFVDSSGRLGLVDFDRFALGESEFDLATVCVELRADASSIRLPVDEHVEAVLDGYRAVAGEPERRRLEVYAIHARLAKVARSASALRPDAADQAARHLRALRGPLADL